MSTSTSTSTSRSTSRPHPQRRTRPSSLRRPLLLSGVALAAAVTLAACGSSTSSNSAGGVPTAGTGATEAGPGDSKQSADAMGGMGSHQGDTGKGLLATEDGYTLRPATSTLRTGPQDVSFQIVDAQGRPQTAYTADQTKLLHFYLVRDDLTGYQHLHPSLRAGTWQIPVTVAAPGRYRMYTDFIAKDEAGKDHPVVLSAALTAPGQATPVPLPPAAPSVTTAGLTAAVQGAVTAGKDSKLTITVSADGKPVTDLQPYLDTYAHMTALRVGDLAYEHVHPELTAQPGKTGGPTLPFAVDLPEPGTWRLFLQVQRQGALRLLPLTITAG